MGYDPAPRVKFCYGEVNPMNLCRDCFIEINDGHIWCAVCRFLTWLNAGWSASDYPDETEGVNS